MCNLRSITQMKNRIREIRELRGISEAELAALVGTSQPQIHRLESGARKLTVDWMRRIARSLDCSPADLIAAPTLEEFADDAVSCIPESMTHFSGALASKNLGMFMMASDALEQIGVPRNTTIMVDMSEEAIKNVQTGDVVIAELHDKSHQLKSTTVIRQYIAPGMLITNRRGANFAVNMSNANFEAHIKGVRVPERKS
jgi:transcriptional regulator with XRE-family HTH domain